MLTKKTVAILALIGVLGTLGLVFLWYQGGATRKNPADRGASVSQDTPATPQSGQAPDNSAKLKERTVTSPSGNTLPPPKQTPAAAVFIPSKAAPATQLPAQIAAPPEPPADETPKLADMEPRVAIEQIRHTVRQFGLTFDGNPVGNNAEITAALSGDNPKGIQFLGFDNSRTNAKGELVDQWQTPYFFHQLTSTKMEIRSAGADREMFTGDDIVTE